MMDVCNWDSNNENYPILNSGLININGTEENISICPVKDTNKQFAAYVSGQGHGRFGITLGNDFIKRQHDRIKSNKLGLSMCIRRLTEGNTAF